MSRNRRSDALVVGRGISARYGTTVAIDGLDITVERGEVVGLVGSNGAGKTTLVRVLCGLLPFQGSLLLSGAGPGSRRAREVVRLAPQTSAFAPEMTVREHLVFVQASILRDGWTVDHVGELLGLSEVLDTRAKALSGGFKRRLHVATALLGRPELVIFDEPTVGMDAQASTQFLDVVRQLAEIDVAVLYTTHRLEELDRVADRLLVLDRGRAVANGSPADLKDRLEHTTVAFTVPAGLTIDLPASALDQQRAGDRIRFRLPKSSQAHVELAELLRRCPDMTRLEVATGSLDEALAFAIDGTDARAEVSCDEP